MSRWLAIWTALIALLVRAENPADPLLVAGVAEFAAAYKSWDRDGFAKAAELVRQASTNTLNYAPCYYWLGVVEFHRMLHLRNLAAADTNRVAVSSVMDAAITALERAVELGPWHAESHALLATLYGMKIDRNMIRAVRFGPRVDRHRTHALAYGAENPRVQYLLGTCQFHTAKKPAAVREALATLLKAEKLFEAEAKIEPGPLDPRWGYASCLMFIGRAYEQLGQHNEAADYYRRVLAQQASNHLARQCLTRVAKDN